MASALLHTSVFGVECSLERTGFYRSLNSQRTGTVSLSGSVLDTPCQWVAASVGRLPLPSRARRSPVPSLHVAIQDSLPGMEDDGSSEIEPREYPAGMQRYESMVILRPDLTEIERASVIERYEEALVAGGALDVEMFNRGMQALTYNIKMKSMGGVMSRYVDGIYLLFTYVTKPASQVELQKRFNRDDDIIRSTTFRLKT